MAKMRNTIVNGGMTGVDKGINRVFGYRNGKSYSQIRKYTKPSNPDSALQLITRERFASTSSGWSALSQERRNAWNLAATEVINVDQFGNKKQSGKNYYTGANVALAQVGAAIINYPGDKVMKAEIGYADITMALGVIELNVELDVIDSQDYVVVSFSRPQSAGTTAFPKMILLASEDLAASIVDKDLTALYTAKFGTFSTGQKLFWQIDTLSSGGHRAALKKGILTV